MADPRRSDEGALAVGRRPARTVATAVTVNRALWRRDGGRHMTQESTFVDIARRAATQVLSRRLVIERSAALLYEVTVDNHLRLTVDPKRPARGRSAFQTDLCVFELRSDVRIPRVVLEFKTRITTHDVITYSAKARKHKQVYPYLRYGLVASSEVHVPGRLFTHNEALDFCLALGDIGRRELASTLGRLLKAEVRASRRLEAIAYGDMRVKLFRAEVVLGDA